MNLLKATGTIGGLTLVSRVLGLVRDSLFARYVGAGFASDAFLVAFRLPNMFRALFAEGAFASAFIPMFNRKAGDPEGRGEYPPVLIPSSRWFPDPQSPRHRWHPAAIR
jgi:putative peptidoglycan lipid II flippase